MKILFFILALFPSPHQGRENVRVVENVLRKQTDIVLYREVYLERTVELPCNITPSLPADRTTLVLWFKNDSLTPFYTYDRTKNSTNPVHWTDPKIEIANRSFFQTSSEMAHLVVQGVQLEDMSEYRCRVDFEQQPTFIQTVFLRVIVPPQRPEIYADNEMLEKNKLGPYRIGDNITLTCIVLGGDPSPSVQWLRDKYIIQTESYRPFPGKLVSKLELIDMNRSNLDTIYTCEARNSNQTSSALRNTVKLDMIFPPVSTLILYKERVMKEAVVETVDCQVVGSRPTPHIIWKLGNQTLQGHTIRHRDNNVTVSRVKIQPFKNRTGLSLTCEASTPGIPEIVISDKLILNVQHEPQVSLRLGQNLDSLNIREGNDVYFVCEVQANPAVKVITWRFNGLEISKGVHRSGNNLIIQNLGRQWEGVFTCQAKNELGEGTSRELKLNIKYAPVCAEGQQQVYETMRGEQLAVSCLVHANPLDHTRFFWKFNNTSRSYYIEDEDVKSFGNHSIAHFTPRNDMDYGTLECWASNSIGKQEHPCQFHVVRGGPPNPPKGCIIKNITYSGFHVECEDTRNLKYRLVSREARTGNLTSDVHQNNPKFILNDLKPGTTYNCRITVYNSDGESSAIDLHQTTLKEPEKQIAERKVREGEGGVGGGGGGTDTSSTLGIILGSSLTLISILLVLLITGLCRYMTRKMKRERGPDLVNDIQKQDEEKDRPGLEISNRKGYSQSVEKKGVDKELDMFSSSYQCLLGSKGSGSDIETTRSDSDSLRVGILPASTRSRNIPPNPSYSTLRPPSSFSSSSNPSSHNTSLLSREDNMVQEDNFYNQERVLDRTGHTLSRVLRGCDGLGMYKTMPRVGLDGLYPGQDGPYSSHYPEHSSSSYPVQPQDWVESSNISGQEELNPNLARSRESKI